MKHKTLHFSFWLPATVILLAGCTESDRDRLVGKWKIDQIEKISSRVTKSDEETANPMQKMSVEFSRSGKLNTETLIGSINSTKTGTWQYQGFEPDSSVMKIECTLGRQTTQHDIEFEDADTIKWIPPNLAGTSQQVRFVRAKN